MDNDNELDLSAVRFVDVRGLRALDRCAAHDDGHRMVVVRPGGALVQLLRTLRGTPLPAPSTRAA